MTSIGFVIPTKEGTIEVKIINQILHHVQDDMYWFCHPDEGGIY
jgi:malate synthase